MAAPKNDKDPVVASQEAAVKALKLEPVDYEQTTTREQRVVAEEESDEPEAEAKE